jgi:acyl-CoA thioesterase FadM
MALSFRFLLAQITALFTKRSQVGDRLQRSFRLLPFLDCEFGRSLNAAQYHRLAEVVQQAHNTQSGFTWQGMRAGLWAMTMSNTIYYRRSLKCWSKISVSVELVGWNEKFWVWENRFFNSTGALSAVSYTKVAVMSRQGIVSPQECFKRLGRETLEKPFPPELHSLFTTLESTSKTAFDS